MRETVTVAAGTSLNSRPLTNGAMIQSLEIDNASGGWLYVVSEKTFVPPYTQGYAINLSVAVAAATITTGAGPSGQFGTSQGDPWTVVLSNDKTVPSNGEPYVGRISQPEWTVYNGVIPTMTFGAGSFQSFATNFLGGSKTLRYRTLSLVASSGTNLFITNVILTLKSMTYVGPGGVGSIPAINLISEQMGPNRQIMTPYLNPPVDSPPGVEMEFDGYLVRPVAGDSESIFFSWKYQIV